MSGSIALRSHFHLILSLCIDKILCNDSCNTSGRENIFSLQIIIRLVSSSWDVDNRAFVGILTYFLIILSFTYSFGSVHYMRLIILVASIANVLGSWPSGWIKSEHKPNTIILSRFIYQEAVSRIVSSDRETLMLPDSFTDRERELLLVWKNLTAEEFLKQALPEVTKSLEMGVRIHPNGELLNEVLATFEGEDGEEVLQCYCMSFYYTIQQVPASEWTTATV